MTHADTRVTHSEKRIVTVQRKTQILRFQDTDRTGWTDFTDLGAAKAAIGGIKISVYQSNLPNQCPKYYSLMPPPCLEKHLCVPLCSRENAVLTIKKHALCRQILSRIQC